MNLYGLRTDSLAFDTIYFNATQQPEKILFSSGVIANDKPFQEAFDIMLNGDIGADKANATIEYLNGKKECGVNIGMVAGLQKVESVSTLPHLIRFWFTANLRLIQIITST